MEEIAKVYKTTDYHLFMSIDGNRNKNPLHISKLKKSMKNNYLFTVIIVNEKYEIIDGQHRFECIKELKLPLYYIICDGYGLNEVHVLNQNSKIWNSDDYLDGYCNMGNEHYIKYKEFKNKYRFGHNECMAMLSGVTGSGGNLTYTFKNGLFKTTHLKESIEIAEKIYMLKDIYDGFKRRSFIFAILYLLTKTEFDFLEFLQKVKNQPNALVNCSDTKQYVLLIEEIYNYRRRNKINLRY